MNTKTPSYQRHRFPSKIISHAVWLYHRFCLIFREVEELLAKRGISVTYETIRRWCQKFGPDYARKLKKRQGRLGDTRPIDEVFVSIQGERHYLWRAVDQDGDVIDILVQRRRNQRAAERFFRRLLKGQSSEPRWLITDKLRSYDAAHRKLMPTVNHLKHLYANNRAEVSHQPTRQQEYHMRGFSSSTQAQRFLTLYGLTQNLFRLGRHLLQAVNYRILRTQAFQVWQDVVCA
jgi:putative transposase